MVLKKVVSQSHTYSIPEINSVSLEIQDGHTWLVFVSDNELAQTNLTDLLKKIVNALNISWDHDVKISPFNTTTCMQFNQFVNSSIKFIVGFGINPMQLSLQGFDTKHQVYSIYNKHLLFADSLETYSNDQSKKVLWKALQEMKS